MQNAVFVLLMLAGGFFSWEMLIGPTVDVVRARGWTKTPCTIVGSEVTAHALTGPERPLWQPRRLLHSLEVGFRYDAGGNTHVSRRYSFAPNVRTSGSVLSRRIAALYTSGTKATCWVNPRNAAEAVINRRFQGSMLLGLAPFLLFLVGFLALLDPLFAKAGASPRRLLSRPAPAEGEAARRRLGKPFENGLIAAAGLAFFAFFGLLAAIGSEVSDLPFLATHLALAVLLGAGYRQRWFAPAALLSAYAFLLLLASVLAIVASGARPLLPYTLAALLGVAPGTTAEALSAFPDLAGRYAAEVGWPIWVLPFVVVLVPLGARRIYLDREKRPALQLCVLLVATALPTIVLLDPLVAAGTSLYRRSAPAPTAAELVADLDSGTPARVSRACTAALDLRDLPEEVFAALLRAAERTTGVDRATCLSPLQHAGAQAKAAEPLFLASLSDESTNVRAAAAGVLGPLAVHLDASRTVPALAAAARKESDLYVRRALARAPGAFEAGAVEAVPELRTLLGDPDGDVRAGAAWSLSRMGPAASPATPDLVRLLADSFPEARQRAVEALAAIGPAAAEAVPALTRLASAPTANLRSEALSALAAIAPESEEVLALLVEAIGDPDPLLQGSGVAAFERAGARAIAAAPRLSALLSSPSPDVRERAADALAAIGKTEGTPAAVPTPGTSPP